MATNLDAEVEAKLAPLREAVKRQAEEVRKLKDAGAPEADWKQALHELKNLKKVLEDKQLELAPPAAAASFDRSKMEDLLKQRFFYQQVRHRSQLMSRFSLAHTARWLRCVALRRRSRYTEACRACTTSDRPGAR